MDMGVILFFATVGLWSLEFFMLGRLRTCVAANAPVSNRALSVIIPARNEAHNPPRLLRSLAAQAVRPQEVIAVDDGSTDRTSEVARQLGATVIASQPLPENWRGKTWACHQGAQAAKGEHFLFVDADTRFEPDGLARVLSRYDGGAFSVGPYHAVHMPYEDLGAQHICCAPRRWGGSAGRSARPAESRRCCILGR